MDILEEKRNADKILDILSTITEEQLNVNGYKSISVVAESFYSPIFAIVKNDDTYIQITSETEANEFISTLIF